VPCLSCSLVLLMCISCTFSDEQINDDDDDYDDDDDENTELSVMHVTVLH